MTRRPDRGFSLLEVMVAVAILAGALTGLSLVLARAVRAAHHARLMTTATFLCRAKLGELEDKFITDGFTDEAGIVEKHGDFKDGPYKDPTFSRYRFVQVVEKIHLPNTSDIQSAATKLLQSRQQLGGSGTSSPAATGTTGDPSSGLGSMLGPVKEMLEQGIRRVTVRVLWDEPGTGEQKVEVVTFYTDVRRIPV